MVTINFPGLIERSNRTLNIHFSIDLNISSLSLKINFIMCTIWKSDINLHMINSKSSIITAIILRLASAANFSLVDQSLLGIDSIWFLRHVWHEIRKLHRSWFSISRSLMASKVTHTTWFSNNSLTSRMFSTFCEIWMEWDSLFKIIELLSMYHMNTMSLLNFIITLSNLLQSLSHVLAFPFFFLFNILMMNEPGSEKTHSGHDEYNNSDKNPEFLWFLWHCSLFYFDIIKSLTHVIIVAFETHLWIKSINKARCNLKCEIIFLQDAEVIQFSCWEWSLATFLQYFAFSYRAIDNIIINKESFVGFTEFLFWINDHWVEIKVFCWECFGTCC